MVDLKELRKIFNEIQEQEVIKVEIKKGFIERIKSTF